MNFARRARALRCAAIVAATLAAGCAHQTPPNTALNTIGDQLAGAHRTPGAATRSAAVREAVLPTAPIETPRTWLPEPRFDLAVSNAPATQVLMAIVTDTRYSMLLPPDLPGKVTINLKDVTVREALEAFGELYGYEYRIDGKRVYVQPQGLQTRIFRVNYLTMKRQGQSDVRVSSGTLVSGAAPGRCPGRCRAPCPRPAPYRVPARAASRRAVWSPTQNRTSGRASRPRCRRSSAPKAGARSWSTPSRV